MSTYVQCHLSMHVCYYQTLYHIIITFIHHHQCNSFHQQFNPFMIIQSLIMPISFNVSLIRSHLV